MDRTLSDLSAWGIRFDFPNDIWQMHLSYREFGSFYDPAVGFVTRNGFRRVEPNVTWRPRPDISWIRQFEFGTQFRYLASIETGRSEERQWQFDILNIDFENSADLDFGVTRQFEYLGPCVRDQRRYSHPAWRVLDVGVGGERRNAESGANQPGRGRRGR